MDMTLVVSLPGTEQTTLVKVGGKGYSLIRMVEAGLPVPPRGGAHDRVLRALVRRGPGVRIL